MNTYNWCSLFNTYRSEVRFGLSRTDRPSKVETVMSISSLERVKAIENLSYSETMELYASVSQVFCHFDQIYIRQFSIFGAFHTIYIGYVAQSGSYLFKDFEVYIGALLLIFIITITSIGIMIRNRSWLRRYQHAMDVIESKYMEFPKPIFIPTSTSMILMIVMFSITSAVITLYSRASI